MSEVVGNARLELLDEEVRGVGAMDEAEEGEREKGERDEGEKREVRHHRGEMGAAVCKELRHEGPLADAHDAESRRRRPGSISLRAWMQPRRSPI